ncbi:MAG TPA: TIR domain-containing protein [Opitutaceae bacterium]|nr:TIR domain-containing protein [Opitutaceae bacterium]
MASSPPENPPPPATTGAVFLSYAREDTDAVRRIADALRAFGVEVWFDQNELRGGDMWDAKIKKQIRECTLFVPVVSGQTQRRTEGYFRREWKLAVERTHDMATGVAFIVPVVIDETREADAAVPEEFMRYQWTRLAQGVPSPQFVEQIKRLVAAPRKATGVGRMAAAPVSAVPAGRGLPPWAWAAAVVALGGAAAFLALCPAAKDSRPPVADTPPPSEVRQLTAQAWALWEKQDDATRDDWALADQLCQRAIALDQSDADVWAVQSQVSLAFVIFGFDTSPARYDAARSQAERAVRLAPDSNEAQFALANYYRRQATTRDEGVRMLRQLIEKMPTDKRVLRTLASALRGQGRYEESIPYSDRANALPGGDPVAMFGKEEALRLLNRDVEGENVIDQVLAVHPTPAGYLKKLRYVLNVHGDLDQARALIEKLPAPFLLEEAGAFAASQVWLWRREPAKVIAVLDAIPKDYIEKGYFYTGPKSYLTGLARQIAGNEEAARTDFRAALQLVEQRLTAQPNNAELLAWKANLLARPGDRPGSEQAFRAFQQLNGGGISAAVAGIMALLGRQDEVVDLIVNSNLPRSPTLLYSPEWDALRGNPRFEAWLKQSESKK